MPRLSSLALVDCEFAPGCLRRLSAAPLLARLTLNHAALDDTLAELGKLPHLTALSLYSTPLTDASLAYVGRLTALRELDLSDTKITNAGLFHLRGLVRLESLDLLFTEITPAGLLPLTDLPQLSVPRTNFTMPTDTWREFVRLRAGG